MLGVVGLRAGLTPRAWAVWRVLPWYQERRITRKGQEARRTDATTVAISGDRGGIDASRMRSFDWGQALVARLAANGPTALCC